MKGERPPAFAYSYLKDIAKIILKPDKHVSKIFYGGKEISPPPSPLKRE